MEQVANQQAYPYNLFPEADQLSLTYSNRYSPKGPKPLLIPVRRASSRSIDGMARARAGCAQKDEASRTAEVAAEAVAPLVADSHGGTTRGRDRYLSRY